MRKTCQFRSRLASGGEILTQSATFLPVEPARPTPDGHIYLLEMQHFAGFLPDFNINRKNSTVARPLLNGGLE